jgi:hypothetical protein
MESPSHIERTTQNLAKNTEKNHFVTLDTSWAPAPQQGPASRIERQSNIKPNLTEMPETRKNPNFLRLATHSAGHPFGFGLAAGPMKPQSRMET